MNSGDSNGKKVEMNLEQVELVADGACEIDLEKGDSNGKKVEMNLEQVELVADGACGIDLEKEDSNGKKVEMNLEQVELVADGACGIDLEKGDSNGKKVEMNLEQVELVADGACEIDLEKGDSNGKKVEMNLEQVELVADGACGIDLEKGDSNGKKVEMNLEQVELVADGACGIDLEKGDSNGKKVEMNLEQVELVADGACGIDLEKGDSNGKKVEMNLEQVELVADGACGVDLERDMSSDEDNVQVNLNTPALRVVEFITPEIFSRKIFIGGLPNMTEDELYNVFSRFGPVQIQWPYKHLSSSNIAPGFAFLVFEEAKSVQKLVKLSVNNQHGLFIFLASKNNNRRPCQLKPWRLSDANFVLNPIAPFDKRNTVFLGGLPKTISAEKVAVVMNRLFDNVVFATINTDEDFKYPKGYGYVGFSTESSYKAALSTKYIIMNTCYANKKVEIKPFIFDKQICEECDGLNDNGKFARAFCPDVKCSKYYCQSCCRNLHLLEGYTSHTPIIKEEKRGPKAVQYRKF